MIIYMDKQPRPETNMFAWGGKLKETGKDGDEKMIEAMSASRFAGWDKVEELGLPGYERTILPLSDFLENPDASLPPEDEQKWFALLEPKESTGQRYRKTLLTRDEILKFVRETVDEHHLNPQEYDLAIVETQPQEYGGNIITSKNGDILIEISKGGQGVVADGTHDENIHGPLFRVTRDPLLGSMKYSWEDGEATNEIPLRKYAHDTLMNIPHEGEGRERTFLEGYYEFHLVKKGENETLKPVFVDARTESTLATLPTSKDIH